MKYIQFYARYELNSHKLLIPCFVPEVLIRFDQQMVNFALKNKSPLSKPKITYSSFNGNDQLSIKRKHNSGKLELKLETEISTHFAPKQILEHAEEMRDFAGEDYEKRFDLAYEKPLSKQSYCEGIYFSPQDVLSMQISVKDNNTIATGSVQDRSSIGPKANLWCAKKTKSKLGSEIIMHLLRHKYQTEVGRKLRNTNEGLGYLKRIVKAYGHVTN